MKKIVLVGGGTAGHIVPNLALIPYLENKREIHYICADTELDKKYLSHKKIKIHHLPVVKLERRFTFKNFLIPFELLKNIKIAKDILKKINPSVVFSKGGFVGLPVAIACKRLNIPFILHESDYSMGLANKISQKYAHKIFITFSDTKTKFTDRTECVGTPIRKEIENGDVSRVFNVNLLDKNKKTILVIGGSQGSQFFNEFFINNSLNLCEKYNIILITGDKHNNSIISPTNFIKIKSVDRIQDYYKIADLVITRGGANVLFELLYLHKPMIIIPLPAKNSRGDQIENAKYFKKKNYAEFLFQDDCNLNNLLKMIDKIENSNICEKNKKINNYYSANQKISDYILKF